MASKTSTPSEEPTFTFKGTVKKVSAATMRAVPVTKRTAVVRVEQIVEAAKIFRSTTGQDITVQLAGRAAVAPGQQFVFHTTGWIFGDGVAVRALAQEPVGRAHRALLDRGGDPEAHHLGRQMQRRVEGSSLVVSGLVTSVHMPAGSAIAARERATLSTTRRPVSEHDPKWREAVVLVDNVHKGHHEQRQVKVLFPSSHDVRWFKAPKFEAGQKGYFLLRKAKVDAAQRAGLTTRDMALVLGPRAEEAEGEVFTALHPLDFQPLTQPLMQRALGSKDT